MRIGELAGETGCQVETIRYYERAGVLPEPARGENNYRQYGPLHRRRLKFVRRCRELGFSLDEIRELLRMVDGGHFTCAEVESIGRRHLEDVRERIRDLHTLESQLAALVSRCDGARTPDCSMLEALFDEEC